MSPQQYAIPLVQQIIKQPMLTSIGLVAFLLIITLALFIPRFETNDDVGMNLIVAGRIFTDIPDEHILYSNVIIGLALKHLYMLFPEIPWYGSYLLSVTLAALVGINYALLRVSRTGSQVLMAILFLAVVGLPCLVELQFTKTAALACLAGLLLFVTAVQCPYSTKWGCAAGILLVVIGCMIRFPSCLLMYIVLSPALAFSLWFSERRRDLWRFVFCLGIALGLGWGFDQYNFWYYSQDDRWCGFYERNELVGRFINDGRVTYNIQTKPVFDEVGWSRIDLSMLKQWNYTDEARFSNVKMRTILERVGLMNRSKRPWKQSIHDMANNKNLWTLLAALFTCLIMARNMRARIVPLFSLGTMIVVCLILIEFYRLPNRVYFSGFGAVLALTIAYSRCEIGWRDLFSSQPKNLLWSGITFLTGGLLIWSVGSAWNHNAISYAWHKGTRDMMTEISPKPDQLFVIWGGLFPYENLIYPLEPMSVSTDFKAVAFGGFVQTPFHSTRLKEFGITDLNRAIFVRRNVYVVINEGLNGLLGANAAEKYGVRLGSRVVYAHPALRGTVKIFQFIDLHNPPSSPGPKPPMNQSP